MQKFLFDHTSDLFLGTDQDPLFPCTHIPSASVKGAHLEEYRQEALTASTIKGFSTFARYSNTSDADPVISLSYSLFGGMAPSVINLRVHALYPDGSFFSAQHYPIDSGLGCSGSKVLTISLPRYCKDYIVYIDWGYTGLSDATYPLCSVIDLRRVDNIHAIAHPTK